MVPTIRRRLGRRIGIIALRLSTVLEFGLGPDVFEKLHDIGTSVRACREQTDGLN